MLELYVQLTNWLRSERGQDLIEYALIVGLLVVVAVLGLSLLGGEISALWIKISGWANAVTTNITT